MYCPLVYTMFLQMFDKLVTTISTSPWSDVTSTSTTLLQPIRDSTARLSYPSQALSFVFPWASMMPMVFNLSVSYTVAYCSFTLSTYFIDHIIWCGLHIWFYVSYSTHIIVACLCFKILDYCVLGHWPQCGSHQGPLPCSLCHIRQSSSFPVTFHWGWYSSMV